MFSTVLMRFVWHWLIIVCAIYGENGVYISRRTTARGPIQSAMDAVSKPELGNFPVLAHDRSTHSSLTCTLAWQCRAHGPNGLYWICLSVGLVFIKSFNTYYYLYTVKWRCSQSRLFVYIQPLLNILCGPQIKNPRSLKSGLGLCFMPILNTFKHNVHNRVFLYIYSRISKKLADVWRFSPQVPTLPYTRKFIII